MVVMMSSLSTAERLRKLLDGLVSIRNEIEGLYRLTFVDSNLQRTSKWLLYLYCDIETAIKAIGDYFDIGSNSSHELSDRKEG
ncbi:hypothetical protein D6827_01960 [Candidatus Parcubacteria bacterium]|nr:MAG: hypothetical protein D6827_01960 [Candidatus Parcubacteria bacterium]